MCGFDGIMCSLEQTLTRHNFSYLLQGNVLRSDYVDDLQGNYFCKMQVCIFLMSVKHGHTPVCKSYFQIRDRDSVELMSFSYSQKTKCGNIAFHYIITEALIFAGNLI